MTADFTFIHLSDIHLCVEPNRKNILSYGPREIDTLIAQLKRRRKPKFRSLLYPATYSPETLSGVARFCADWSEEIDAVLISGDLCTTGTASDLNVGANFLSSPFLRGVLARNYFPSISETAPEIILIPGNHDRYANNLGEPNSVAFDLKFSEYLPNFSNRVGYAVFEKDGFCLCFAVADFSLRSKADAIPPLHFGRGKVYDDVLEGLGRVTSELRVKHKNCQVVWLVHFPPYDCGFELKLIDSEYLLNASIDYDVKYLLCGHTHVSKKEVTSALTTYCAGSSAGIDVFPNNEVHVLKFAVTKKRVSLTRETYGWSKGDQAFSILLGRD